MTAALPPDRRAALKARHRRAIVEAAQALIAEGARFSVDQLAERADVSRRTIFNHFVSIDDVVTTACTEVLGVVIENFRAHVSAATTPTGSRAAMFDEVAAALRATDVPGFVAFLWRALGGFDGADPRPKQLFQATVARTADELARELVRRHPQRDPLEAELLVSTLMHGTEVIAVHWLADTAAATDERSRAHWHDLLDRLLETTRAGYRADETESDRNLG